MPTPGTLTLDVVHLILSRNCDQQEDTVEYEPTCQPNIKYFEKSGTSANQPAVNDNESQKLDKLPTETEKHYSIRQISRNRENSKKIQS